MGGGGGDTVIKNKISQGAGVQKDINK